MNQINFIEINAMHFSNYLIFFITHNLINSNLYNLEYFAIMLILIMLIF